MPMWDFTITITEHERHGQVEAETAEQARQKIHAAKWDREFGLSDPEGGYTIHINGKVTPAKE